MEVTIHYPTEPDAVKSLQEKTAYFQATLIMKSINNLEISQKDKTEVLKNIINKLEQNKK